MVHVDGSGMGTGCRGRGAGSQTQLPPPPPASSRLEENPPENISELRALEANCAASYFRSWVRMPIKWRGTSRRPIPENWHFIGQRSSPYHLAGNRNAAHPVNATLNYAYAALESEIRIKAISEGYDPTIGIMHEGSDGSSKFHFRFNGAGAAES
jgi:CRISP-associated protein Cas1